MGSIRPAPLGSGTKLREQYYLASFSPHQPELNWRNPEVREAMMDALRFWLERGADGFRVDMLDFLGKDAEFRDEPPETARG